MALGSGGGLAQAGMTGAADDVPAQTCHAMRPSRHG